MDAEKTIPQWLRELADGFEAGERLGIKNEVVVEQMDFKPFNGGYAMTSLKVEIRGTLPPSPEGQT